LGGVIPQTGFVLIVRTYLNQIPYTKFTFSTFSTAWRKVNGNGANWCADGLIVFHSDATQTWTPYDGGLRDPACLSSTRNTIARHPPTSSIISRWRGDPWAVRTHNPGPGITNRLAIKSTFALPISLMIIVLGLVAFDFPYA
jgi:hypothetical protein